MPSEGSVRSFLAQAVLLRQVCSTTTKTLALARRHNVPASHRALMHTGLEIPTADMPQCQKRGPL